MSSGNTEDHLKVTELLSSRQGPSGTGKNLKKIWKRGEEFFKKVYLTMVAFHLSERLSEAKQGD